MVHAALSQVVLIRTIGDVDWGIRESYYTVTMRQGESTRVHSSSPPARHSSESSVWFEISFSPLAVDDSLPDMGYGASQSKMHQIIWVRKQLVLHDFTH